MDKITRVRERVEDAKALLQEAIENEDFQPAYAQANFLCGPALLGTLTRAFDALVKVCPPEPAEPDCDRCDSDPLAYVEDREQFEQQKSGAHD